MTQAARFVPALLLSWLVSGAAAGAALADPATAHRQILDLRAEFMERRNAGDEPGAAAVLQRMASIDPEHPWTYSLAGNLHRSTKDWAAAETLMRSLGSEGPGLAYGLAYLAYYNDDRESAERLLREALALYRARRHAPGEALCRYFLAEVIRDPRGRRREEALVELEAARALFEALDDPSGVARVVHALGRLERTRDDPGRALALFREALEARQFLGERDLEAETWLEIAHTQWRAARLDEAAEAFERALELQRLVGDPRSQYEVLRGLCQVHAERGHTDDAERCWVEAEQVAAGQTAWLAQLHFDRAHKYLSRDMPQEAIDLLRLAIDECRAAGSSWTEARALRDLGRALLETGQLAGAAESLSAAVDRAAQVSSAGDARALEASALGWLALVSQSTGDLARALSEQEEVLRLWREDPPDRTEEANALNNLGSVEWRLGLGDTAMRHLAQALDLARELDDATLLGRFRGSLGVVLSEAGRHEEALAHLRASVELRQQLDQPAGTPRYNLAWALSRAGQPDAAVSVLEQALIDFRASDDAEGEAFALGLSAHLLGLKGSHAEAIRVASRGIALAESRGFQHPLWDTYAVRAAAHEGAQKPDLALADLKRAVEVIEALRARIETSELKMRFFADKAAVYERAVALEARLRGGDAAAAFEMAERARARSLLDLLAESRATGGSGLPAERIAGEARLADQVGAAAARLARAAEGEAQAAARLELDAAEARLRSLRVEARLREPRRASIVYPERITLREARESLAEDELLLRYFVGEKHAMLWIADRQGTRFHALPPPQEIARLVDLFRERAGRATVALGGRIAGQAESEELAAMLRVADLPPGRRLIVVPDGPLHHLPFDALRRKGRYLVEAYDVVTVPSAAALRLMRRHPAATAQDGFLGVGGPSGDDPRYPPLAHSAQALERIARLFAPERRVVLQGPEATKKALRAQPLDRFRYVHFAAHGWLDEESSGFFGLRLAPASAGAKDDFLHLDDLFSLDMAADLVVLSACSSGGGELLSGEGLVGMTRGFLYAGAHAVLVSLWNVGDDSTAEFMEAFYRELTAGRAAPEALRRVKLQFLRAKGPGRKQPYRWAPFVLVGDPAGGALVAAGG